MARYIIPEITKDALNAKVSKWNKKAIKLNVEPFVIDYGIPYCTKDFTPYEISVVEFDIIGEIPHYDGWEFISKVDHTLGTPIFSNAPYKTLPTDLRNSCTNNCEHCHSKRARNKTYIVAKEGVYKNVGSTCVKDFFNQDIERHINSFFNIFDEIGDFCSNIESFTSAPQVFDTKHILELTFAEILERGFASKASERETETTSTATWIELWLLTGKKDLEIIPSDKAIKLANEALEWIKNELSGDNEFVHNLKAFANIGYIQSKYISFVAAGANSYFKKINAFVPNSEWVGEIKDKIETTVTIIGKKTWANNYGGWTTLFRFKDDNDRLLVWFASNPPESFNVDDIVSIKGTVKKHDQYNDIKQTILTRVKEL